MDAFGTVDPGGGPRVALFGVYEDEEVVSILGESTTDTTLKVFLQTGHSKQFLAQLQKQSVISWGIGVTKTNRFFSAFTAAEGTSKRQFGQ
jgi:hypothetical protein